MLADGGRMMEGKLHTDYYDIADDNEPLLRAMPANLDLDPSLRVPI